MNELPEYTTNRGLTKSQYQDVLRFILKNGTQRNHVNRRNYINIVQFVLAK